MKRKRYYIDQFCRKVLSWNKMRHFSSPQHFDSHLHFSHFNFFTFSYIDVFKRSQILPSTRGWPSKGSFAFCHKTCRRAGRVGWSCTWQEKLVLTNCSSILKLIKSHHVWAEGRRSVERSSRWIWNFCVPFMPSRAAKPCRGTFDVPVTNWRNLARSAWSKLRSARQNHWICLKIWRTLKVNH